MPPAHSTDTLSHHLVPFHPPSPIMCAPSQPRSAEPTRGSSASANHPSPVIVRDDDAATDSADALSTWCSCIYGGKKPNDYSRLRFWTERARFDSCEQLHSCHHFVRGGICRSARVGGARTDVVTSRRDVSGGRMLRCGQGCWQRWEQHGV